MLRLALIQDLVRIIHSAPPRLGPALCHYALLLCHVTALHVCLHFCLIPAQSLSSGPEKYFWVCVLRESDKALGLDWSISAVPYRSTSGPPLHMHFVPAFLSRPS